MARHLERLTIWVFPDEVGVQGIENPFTVEKSSYPSLGWFVFVWAIAGNSFGDVLEGA